MALSHYPGQIRDVVLKGRDAAMCEGLSWGGGQQETDRQWTDSGPARQHSRDGCIPTLPSEPVERGTQKARPELN